VPVIRIEDIFKVFTVEDLNTSFNVYVFVVTFVCASNTGTLTKQLLS
jgi:hypothetical protein